MAISDETLNGLVAHWNQMIKRVKENTEDRTEIYIRASYELYHLLLLFNAHLSDAEGTRRLLLELLGGYEDIMDKAGIDYIVYKLEMVPHHTLDQDMRGASFMGEIGDEFLDG